MVIYVVEYVGEDKIYRSYEGMSEETVRALVMNEGNHFEIIDKDTYDADVAKALAALPKRNEKAPGP